MKRPQFVYWLTLNSHLPVPASSATDTEDCRASRRALSYTTGGICRLVAVITDTTDALATMLADPNLPPTDILIMGDHMPPFFDHASRSRFDPHRVPWVRLTPHPSIRR